MCFFAPADTQIANRLPLTASPFLNAVDGQMKRILLIGCGNIGFRHLQALGAAVAGGSVLDLTVVEPNHATHDRIAEYLAALPGGTPTTLVDTLPEAPHTYDLGIFATNAAQRRAAFDAALARHDMRAAVFEKVLFTTLRDLDDVGNVLEKSRIAGFVNCGRRTAPGYQDLRVALQSAPTDIEVTGANFGLGSNAVHFLDLAEFLNGAAITALDAAGLRPGSVPSKRHGYVEIFGTISAQLSNGATIRVTCDIDGVPSVAVRLTAAGERIEIDETGRRISRAGTEVTFEMRHVSELTDTYRELLDTGRCHLTPYADSARQHRFFLAKVLDHLGRAANPDESCPIS